MKVKQTVCVCVCLRPYRRQKVCAGKAVCMCESVYVGWRDRWRRGSLSPRIPAPGCGSETAGGGGSGGRGGGGGAQPQEKT